MNAQDMGAVEACIQDYFEALYNGDTDLLMGSVFHPNAHLYAANLGGGFVDWPMDDFRKVIESRPSPRSTGAERVERIVSMDEAGPDTVMVKVEVRVGTRDFVDYLSVLKLDGAWRIISKTCVMIKDHAEAAA